MNKNNFLVSFQEVLNNNDSNFLETIIFIIYMVSVITLSCFHEPWFDEFQAWGISKDSLYNIFFVIPHYECHPPLWHLILKCFSIFNLPAELCIKIPNLTFIFASIWLILFKSPFPRCVKLLLPFTYFIFYQYAIISRPYSMFVFALLLVAIFYKTKNKTPFKFIFSLAFLTLTSLYGMIIATGITLIWVYEIWNKQNLKAFLKYFCKDTRFYAMLLLFFLCLFVSIIIFPDKNVTGRIQFDQSPTIIRVLYSIFGTMADSTIFNLLNYSIGNFCKDTSLFRVILNLALGIYIYIILFRHFYKQNLLRFFFIFPVISIFFIKYVYPHHLGLLFLFIVFTFWITYENNRNGLKLDKQISILIILTLIIHLSWSLLSSIYEIKYDYSPHRTISTFIKKYSLTDYKIFSAWQISDVFTDEQGKTYSERKYLEKDKKYTHYIYENTNHQIYPVLINPYFNKNIFYNFNYDNHEKLHVIHIKAKPEKNSIEKNKWFTNGSPDLIISDIVSQEKPFYNYVQNYNILKIFDSSMIWKDSMYASTPVIYVRKDLYNEIKERIYNTP